MGRKVECCNLIYSICEIHLFDGEEICPKCNGLGGKIHSVSFKQKYFRICRCRVCGGTGKVDWITAATGREASVYDPLEIKSIPLKCPKNKSCKKRKRIARNFWYYITVKPERKKS